MFKSLAELFAAVTTICRMTNKAAGVGEKYVDQWDAEANIQLEKRRALLAEQVALTIEA